MGINWWESDPSLQRLEQADQNQGRLEQENRQLRERIERLERQLGTGDGQKGSAR
jgi:cell division septum initiation protein DivIVA